MIITKIELQKNNATRHNIYIDNEYFCSLDIDLIYDLKISEGMEINKEEFENIIQNIYYKKAYNYILRLLTKSNKTEYEIRSKLISKNYNEAIINKVIEKLKQQNYLNDEKFIDNWLNNYSTKTGINKKQIYNKLLQKGIKRCLIEQKIDENIIDEYESAYKLALKKYKTMKDNNNNSNTNKDKKKKIISYLYSKGFNLELCCKIADKI